MPSVINNTSLLNTGIGTQCIDDIDVIKVNDNTYMLQIQSKVIAFPVSLTRFLR